MKMRVFVAVLAVALAIFQLRTQLIYVDISRSLPGHPALFLEIPGASFNRILTGLNRFEKAIPSKVDVIVSDTYNIVLGKIERDYTAGRTIVFPTANFDRLSYPILKGLRRDPVAATMVDAKGAAYHPAYFVYFDKNAKHIDRFFVDRLEENKNESVAILLKSSNLLSLFNRSYRADATFSAVPFRSVNNFSAFVDSSMGHFYADAGTKATLYSLEPDYFSPGNTMAGVGRYLLLEIIHPSSKIRLVMDLSASLIGDGVNALPPATVYGTNATRLPFMGAGAGRVISLPFKPLRIGSLNYALIDMGVEGKRFKYQRTGLQSLFGKNIELDNRVLVAFARNISVVDDFSYQQIRRPSDFVASPGAVLSPRIVFSGIYEDGWISRQGYIELKRSVHSRLHFSGFVPLLKDPSFKVKLVVNIDGRKVIYRELPVGNFDVLVPNVSRDRFSTVSWLFSGVQNLPGDDRRPVSAKLLDIGFR